MGYRKDILTGKPIKDAINGFRDPKLVEKEEAQKQAEKEQRQAAFQRATSPIFNMIFRDAMLAKEVGAHMEQGNRRSEKLKEQQERTEKLQRSMKLDARTKAFLRQGDDLRASLDGEHFRSFGQEKE